MVCASSRVVGRRWRYYGRCSGGGQANWYSLVHTYYIKESIGFPLNYVIIQDIQISLVFLIGKKVVDVIDKQGETYGNSR
jgi:hypothetical protein